MSSEPLTVEPVIFELSSDVVRVSTELNIRFSRPSLCPGSRYWRVEDSSKAVVLNGSKSSNDSTFTIQKFGKSYKLAFGSADKPTDVGLERIRIEDYSVSTELNIKFARPSLCGGSDYWRVEDSSSPIKPVVLNGTKSSNDSTFTIQKFGGSYKLVFGSADKPTDIGLQKNIIKRELRVDGFLPSCELNY
ncbi:unnamed protein product [Brassica oleracea var. botrytis]|uniref:(rape) hypothetical protein n=1 Tax=Brassica napus TaxID=3708 RepID=A0A816QSH0_BRANA|nr:unnamed protein product [Brassica napus]